MKRLSAEALFIQLRFNTFKSCGLFSSFFFYEHRIKFLAHLRTRDDWLQAVAAQSGIVAARA